MGVSFRAKLVLFGEIVTILLNFSNKDWIFMYNYIASCEYLAIEYIIEARYRRMPLRALFLRSSV